MGDFKEKDADDIFDVKHLDYLQTSGYIFFGTFWKVCKTAPKHHSIKKKKSPTKRSMILSSTILRKTAFCRQSIRFLNPFCLFWSHGCQSLTWSLVGVGGLHSGLVARVSQGLNRTSIRTLILN